MKRSFYGLYMLVSGLTAGESAHAGLIGKTEGDLRLGYEWHDQQQSKRDAAVGGSLKIEIQAWHGIASGVGFYTVQGIDHHDNLFIPFYDNDNHSYSLLGEAYLQGAYRNSTLTVGRQVIDTPFADSDDIGMIPNRFEAYTLRNRDLENTTLTVTHIVKMAGVDAADPGRFTSVNPGNGVDAIGLEYEGLTDTAVSGWYYHARGIEDIAYLEAWHVRTAYWGSYRVGLQYALQDATGPSKAHIWGVMGETTLERYGIDLMLACNGVYSTADGTADNFLGGGPFFTSDEHLTLAEAGVNGKSVMGSLSYDAGQIGLDALTLTVSTLYLRGDDGVKADEVDLMAGYAPGDDFSFDLIYSDVDDHHIHTNSFQNLRAFVNYRF